MRGISSVTSMLDAGKSPEQMLEILLDGLSLQVTDTMSVEFFCDCSREKIEKVLISLGEKELSDMVEEGKEVEVNCSFCSRHYLFNVDELEGLYRRSR